MNLGKEFTNLSNRIDRIWKNSQNWENVHESEKVFEFGKKKIVHLTDLNSFHNFEKKIQKFAKKNVRTIEQSSHIWGE